MAASTAIPTLAWAAIRPPYLHLSPFSCLGISPHHSLGKVSFEGTADLIPPVHHQLRWSPVTMSSGFHKAPYGTFTIFVAWALHIRAVLPKHRKYFSRVLHQKDKSAEKKKLSPFTASYCHFCYYWTSRKGGGEKSNVICVSRVLAWRTCRASEDDQAFRSPNIFPSPVLDKFTDINE